jgi:NhaA family Na+:H+ antiporter
MMKIVPEAAIRSFQRFFKAEASAGILLMAATVVAFVWANSGWSDLYFQFWEIPIGALVLTKTLHHWINDGLMSIFFLVVGLEIKREMIAGQLASIRRAALPIVAAIGGMLVPAAFYLLFNTSDPQSRGWGIPMATDIAFSLGVLALLGSRIPVALKVFLSAFAIVDDIGAVLVIAFFYTQQLSLIMLVFGMVVVIVLFLLNRLNVLSLTPYLLIGLLLWFFILKSGVHATIAGVLTAMLIPSAKIEKLEDSLHTAVAFVIVPLFALANAGVSLQGVTLSLLSHPVFLGIVIGLVLGKQLGVFFASFLSVKTSMASLPEDVRWRHVYGAGWLGGIGFTMSIFISDLAFQGSELLPICKLAILCASLISAIGGWIVLKRG